MGGGSSSMRKSSSRRGSRRSRSSRKSSRRSSKGSLMRSSSRKRSGRKSSRKGSMRSDSSRRSRSSSSRKGSKRRDSSRKRSSRHRSDSQSSLMAGGNGAVSAMDPSSMMAGDGSLVRKSSAVSFSSQLDGAAGGKYGNSLYDIKNALNAAPPADGTLGVKKIQPGAERDAVVRQANINGTPAAVSATNPLGTTNPAAGQATAPPPGTAGTAAAVPPATKPAGGNKLFGPGKGCTCT